MTGIRIALVLALPLVRESLKSLVNDQADLSVIGETGNAAEGVRIAQELGPDVVVMECGLPGASPLDAARQIARVCPATRVLFLSFFPDEDALFECMEAGAAGFLPRETTGDELIQAIRQVGRGCKYLTEPALSRFLNGWKVRKKEGGGAGSILTARETEVIKLLAEGNSVKACADILQVSAKTVEGA